MTPAKRQPKKTQFWTVIINVTGGETWYSDWALTEAEHSRSLLEQTGREPKYEMRVPHGWPGVDPQRVAVIDLGNR